MPETPIEKLPGEKLPGEKRPVLAAARRKTVLIADDHPVYRRGLRELLQAAFDVVAEASMGDEAVAKALEQRPNVVLLDVQMPGLSGIEATRAIKERLPDTSVVVVSASRDSRQVFEAIRAGASGYLAKDDEVENILKAIEEAAGGNAFLPPGIAKQVLEGMAGAASPLSPEEQLTAREEAVLRLLAQGKRNHEIARELFISQRTVANHISSIYSKAGVRDRAQATAWAIRTGLVSTY